MDEEDGRTGPQARKFGRVDVPRDAVTGFLCLAQHPPTIQDLRGRHVGRARAHSSGAKAPWMLLDSTYGLKPVPFTLPDSAYGLKLVPFTLLNSAYGLKPVPFKTARLIEVFSQGLKPPISIATVTARLKPCPCYRTFPARFFRVLKRSDEDSAFGTAEAVFRHKPAAPSSRPKEKHDENVSGK